MRPPREILFARHRGVEAKLDAVRRAAMTEVRAVSRQPVRHPRADGGLLMAAAFKLWRELVWPCRRTWCGLALTWLVLLLVNVHLRGPSLAAYQGEAASTAEVARSFAVQQRVLAELLQPAPPPPAQPPRPTPRPRSEGRVSTKVG